MCLGGREVAAGWGGGVAGRGPVIGGPGGGGGGRGESASFTTQKHGEKNLLFNSTNHC